MTYNPSIRIHVNKIENKITFRRKTGHHLELLITETRKLLGITKSQKWWKCASLRNHWSSINIL